MSAPGPESGCQLRCRAGRAPGAASSLAGDVPSLTSALLAVYTFDLIKTMLFDDLSLPPPVAEGEHKDDGDH
jgi:hypothetical protein